MQRETFVNRKIPLNANINVQVGQVSGLRECVKNIEHFSKVYQLSDSALEEGCPSVHFDRNNHVEMGSHSNKTGVVTNRKEAIQKGKELTDKRRITTQILKEGLNIAVFASVFDQDDSLKERVGGMERTRLIFNTLQPVFNEGFDFNVQMDNNVFNYIKNKKAVFEVRHYIKKDRKTELSSDFINGSKIEGSNVNKSLPTDDEEDEFLELHDHMVLGRVKIPLFQLLSKNSGIDGDFMIFDEWHQQMGSLKLRININQHNSQRPLYA